MSFELHKLTSSEFKILHVLLKLHSGGIVANKALKFISTFTSVSKTTLLKALDSLESKGFIEIIHAKPSPVRKEVNTYKILCPLDIFNIEVRNKREYDESKWDNDFFDNLG